MSRVWETSFTRGRLVKETNPINITAKIKEGILIDSVLMEVGSVDEARNINISNIGFYDEGTKTYKSSEKSPEVITDKSIRRVSIKLDDNNTRYFQLIDYIDGVNKDPDVPETKEFYYKFQVAKLYDAILAIPLQSPHKNEAIEAINTALFKHIRQPITIEELNNKKKIVTKLLSAILNKYSKSDNAIEEFLSDIQDSNRKLSDNNPLKTYKLSDEKHGSVTGLKAKAWQEIDAFGDAIKKNGRQEIRLNFSGYSGKRGNAHEENSVVKFVNGKLNPQAIETVAFTDRIIKNFGKNNISNIIFGAHSMGSSNALVAHIVSKLNGVPTQTTLLLEPIGASSQLIAIKNAMKDERSELFQKLQTIIAGENLTKEIIAVRNSLDDEIAKNVISIRTIENERKNDRDADCLKHSKSASLTIGSGMLSLINPFSAKRKIIGEHCHEGNEAIGKTFLMILPETDIKPHGLISRLDITHTLGAIIRNAYNDKTIYHEVITQQTPSPYR